MTYRIAKKPDARALAKIHLECGRNQPGGFMHHLGLLFLIRYYKVLLNEGHSLVVLAENDGTICGFHSGTAKAEEHQRALRRHMFELSLALLPRFLLRPGLALEALRRFSSLGSGDSRYRVTHGPRGEYWAWLPAQKDPACSLKVLEIWHSIMRSCGVRAVRFEVDLCNKRVADNFAWLNAEVLREVVLPDGRRRQILELSYAAEPGKEVSFLRSRASSKP